MRKLLLLLTAIFCSVVLITAQERYEVNVKSPLNVRSSASTNSKVIGILPNGSTVDVYEFYGDWAKIEYNSVYAYVSSKYLKKCEIQPEYANFENEENQGSFWSSINLRKYATSNLEWMVFVILTLSIFMAFMRKFGTPGNVFLTIFTVVCIMECIYLLMSHNGLWFCMPDDVGWGWAIVGFLTLGWVSYNQIMCFFDAMMSVKGEEGGFSLTLGLYSWIIAIIAGVIVYLFGWEEYLVYIIIILGVCQLIQMWLIVAGVKEYGIPYGLLAAMIYLIGTIATLLVLIQFLVLLIIVIIAALILMVFLGAIGSSSGSSNNTSREDTSSEGYLDPENGLGRIHGRFLNNDTFQEYGGSIYDKQADGSFKKRDW